MKTLTVKQLKDICSKNRFIKLRCTDNSYAGYNCGLYLFNRFKDVNPNIKTKFISYTSINFMEYISIKVPFIN